MKNIKQLTLSVLALTAALCASELSCAASDDECAIWLCAPSSFPSPYCNGAYSAFKKRIKKGKNPFPSLSSCTEDGQNPDGIVGKTGDAAYVPTHAETRCLRYEKKEYRTAYGAPAYKDVCVDRETYTVPAKYIDGRVCVIRQTYAGIIRDPEYCTGTVQTIKIFDGNGNQIGETFYY